MDPIIVLFVCKAVTAPFASPLDEANSKWTGHHPTEWVYEGSKMICQRKEIQVFDQAAAQGADPRPFTKQQCMATGIMEGVRWDQQHSRYKFWRVACPTPIVDTRTGKILGWKIPECPHRDVVICELDTAI